jgi:hypothetical protein
MTMPPLAKALARLLADDPADTEVLPGNREDTIAEMTRRIRTRRRRRSASRWLAATSTAAAAAAAMLVIGLHRSGAPAHGGVDRVAVVAARPSGGVLVVSGGHATPLHDGARLDTGDHVLTLLDGGVAMALSTGTRLAIEGGSDVAILNHDATQLFALEAGAMRADVAKLKGAERFVIRTRDAEVEVHGTSFRVASADSEPGCGVHTKTRVQVYEGVVTVRTGATSLALRAGESWPPPCAIESTSDTQHLQPSQPEPPPAPTVTETSASAELPRTAPPAAAPPRPSSDLAAQNDLFDQAMSARSRGDSDAALASLGRLLERYPSSPFAESAAFERIKLLAGIDRARAADEAREYLRRYPSGFGRADAEALIR